MTSRTETSKQMTRAEFLTQLSLVRDRFEWTLSPQAAGQASRIRQHIRAVPREAPQLVLDPLGALCYTRFHVTIKPGEWARAGEVLGLAAPGDLVAAANDQTWAGTGPRREPIVYLQQLRKRMEMAVGLSPIEPRRSGNPRTRDRLTA